MSITTTTYDGTITVAERDEIRWVACELLAQRHLFLTSGDGDDGDWFEHTDRYYAVARALGSLGMDLFSDDLPRAGFNSDGLRALLDGAADLESIYGAQVEDRQSDPEYRAIAETGLERVKRARRAIEWLLAPQIESLP